VRCRSVERVAEIGGQSGTVISFDVNYRTSLWSPHQAAPVLSRLAASADLVFAGSFAGSAEAALMLGDRPVAGPLMI
jgi:2-dehydro-3-deoxygluconokinase